MLTNENESDIITKLSQKRQGKISQNTSQKKFKEILKKVLTSGLGCDIIIKLAQNERLKLDN